MAELGRGRRSPVAAVDAVGVADPPSVNTNAASAGHGGDDPAAHFAHPAVAVVGDVEGTGAVDGHAPGGLEQGLGGGAAVARIPPLIYAQGGVAGHLGHHTARVDLAHPVVPAVGKVGVGGVVDGDTQQFPPELRRGGLSAVAAVEQGAVAGHGVDDPSGVHPADAPVASVGDVEL